MPRKARKAATPAPPHQAPAAFRADLDRLVAQFERNLDHYKSHAYDEAGVRAEFLNPMFRALGWDMENQAGLIPL